MCLIHDQPSNFHVQIGHEQLTDKDVNPANQTSIRSFCDVDGVVIAVLNLLEPLAYLFWG